MTRVDRKILFTALAFVTVLTREKDAKSEEAAEKIRQLSGLIEAYCMENVVNVFAAADDTGASIIDHAIERHLRELREAECTKLPEDKQMLIRFHDRLQHRKTRRCQRAFYASATETKLADLVLNLMDEELEDEGNAALA